MLLSKIAGIQFTPVSTSVNKTAEKNKDTKSVCRQVQKQRVSDSGPLSFAVKCLSDEDIASINKMKVLPAYAKVVSGKNGLEVSIAKGENDGIHVLPDGYKLTNTEKGTTIITR